MAKRRHDGQEVQESKRHKCCETQKRRADILKDPRATKRHKTYEYWHLAPLTREERAAHMAAIYEHLCCKA